MKLYKFTYTQESEAFVSADSEEEAYEYITELTENGGGEKMSWVRLVECGWGVTEEYGELTKATENDSEGEELHETEDGSYWYQDGRLFWD